MMSVNPLRPTVFGQPSSANRLRPTVFGLRSSISRPAIERSISCPPERFSPRRFVMRRLLSRSSRAPMIVAALIALAIPARAQSSRAASQKATQELAAQLRELDAFVAKGLKDWGIPGLSVSIVKNDRSEERRVGKEGRSRWSPYH